MTGNANILAKDLLRKIDFLKYDVLKIKDDIDIYRGSQALDFTEYDKKVLKNMSDKLNKINEDIVVLFYSLKLLSGN